MRQVGSGLIEVLIAIVILAFGVLGLGRFQSIAMQDISSSRNRSQAMELAQAKLEAMRNFVSEVGYAAIVTGSDEALLVGVNTRFSRSWDVATLHNPPYKEVTITVAWADALGVDQAVRLASFIGYRDPVGSGSDLDGFGDRRDDEDDKNELDDDGKDEREEYGEDKDSDDSSKDKDGDEDDLNCNDDAGKDGDEDSSSCVGDRTGSQEGGTDRVTVCPSCGLD